MHRRRPAVTGDDSDEGSIGAAQRGEVERGPVAAGEALARGGGGVAGGGPGEGDRGFGGGVREGGDGEDEAGGEDGGAVDESCEGFRVGVDQVLQENAERDQQIEQWMMVINNILLVYDDHTLSKIAIFEDLDEKLLKCWRSTTICLCMMIIHYQIML